MSAIALIGLILDYTTSTVDWAGALKYIFFLCLFYFRLSEKEKELEQFRAGKLLEWKIAADNVQKWLVKHDAKFQSFEDLSSDLDEVRQQKSETEVRQRTLPWPNFIIVYIKMCDLQTSQLWDHLKSEIWDNTLIGCGTECVN